MSVAYNGEIKPLDCTTGTPCFLLPAWNAVRAERERETRSETGQEEIRLLTHCSVLVLSVELPHSPSCLLLPLHLMTVSGIQTSKLCVRQAAEDLNALLAVYWYLKNNGLLFEFATYHQLKQLPNNALQLLTCIFLYFKN